MKKRIFYLSLLTAALVSGCIKEEGETYTIVRAIEQPDSKDETKPATVFTGVKGYMYGKAEADVVVTNTFQTIINNNQIKELDCYVKLKSSYSEIDVTKNAAKEVGYVYSRTNKDPMIGGSDCSVVDPKKVKSDEVNESKESFTFEGEAHSLDFNAQYYMRSYFISTNDDTIYNPRVTSFNTVLPEDVWFKRNDAPDKLTKRTEPLSATLGEKVYIYGGRNGTTYYNDLWTYNKKSDTWEQLATFDGSGTYYAGCTKRCNGASFLYPIAGKDTLIYFVGGEIAEGEYTPEVFYYSVYNARFANEQDHPNYSQNFDLYNSDHTPIYVKKQKVNEQNQPLYYDENNQETTDQYREGGIENTPVLVDTDQIEKGKCSRSHVEPLPLGIQNNKPTYGLAGMVAFSLEDQAIGRKCFVAFGKNDWSKDGDSQFSSIVYEYDVTYDRVCNALNESSTLTWSNRSATTEKNAEGYYQPICIECGDKVIFGCGETPKGLSKSFFQLSWSTSQQKLRMEEIATPPDGFVARANAAAFYLDYTKNGDEYQRLYVGTGRNCTEDEYVKDPEQLLNDLWCYDFSSREWIERSELSNIPRQGAVGFTVMRNDDYYSKTFEENQRGYISFGEGYIKGSGLSYLNDNWEYLP